MIKTNSGQSLFEVVIALAVISVVMVGLINVTTISIRNTSFSRNNTLATRYAQEAMEWLRGQRDASWNTFVGFGTTATYCLDTLSWGNPNACGATELISGTSFTRSVALTCFRNSGTVAVACNNVAADTLQATVSVVWTDAQGSHTVSTPIQFTNWRGTQ